MESKPERLEVGLEVEYTVFNRDKGGKVSAENVKLLRKVSSFIFLAFPIAFLRYNPSFINSWSISHILEHEFFC